MMKRFVVLRYCLVKCMLGAEILKFLFSKWILVFVLLQCNDCSNSQEQFNTSNKKMSFSREPTNEPILHNLLEISNSPISSNSSSHYQTNCNKNDSNADNSKDLGRPSRFSLNIPTPLLHPISKSFKQSLMAKKQFIKFRLSPQTKISSQKDSKFTPNHQHYLAKKDVTDSLPIGRTEEDMPLISVENTNEDMPLIAVENTNEDIPLIVVEKSNEDIIPIVVENSIATDSPVEINYLVSDNSTVTLISKDAEELLTTNEQKLLHPMHLEFNSNDYCVSSQSSIPSSHYSFPIATYSNSKYISIKTKNVNAAKIFPLIIQLLAYSAASPVVFSPAQFGRDVYFIDFALKVLQSSASFRIASHFIFTPLATLRQDSHLADVSFYFLVCMAIYLNSFPCSLFFYKVEMYLKKAARQASYNKIYNSLLPTVLQSIFTAFRLAIFPLHAFPLNSEFAGISIDLVFLLHGHLTTTTTPSNNHNRILIQGLWDSLSTAPEASDTLKRVHHLLFIGEFSKLSTNLQNINDFSQVVRYFDPFVELAANFPSYCIRPLSIYINTFMERGCNRCWISCVI